MKLVTDFSDYYDFMADGRGPVLRRLSRSGMGRREMLAYLESLGIPVPAHGLVSQLVSRGATQLVVYLDEDAHGGHGKVLLDSGVALARHPECYCTQYVATCDPRRSYRYLQVGRRSFWLLYESYSDWRSNVGDGETRVLMENREGYASRIGLPLFAVDFVRCFVAGFIAIDFNIAPGLKATGMQSILSPGEVVSLLDEAMAVLAAAAGRGACPGPVPQAAP